MAGEEGVQRTTTDDVLRDYLAAEGLQGDVVRV